MAYSTFSPPAPRCRAQVLSVAHRWALRHLLPGRTVAQGAQAPPCADAALCDLAPRRHLGARTQRGHVACGVGALSPARGKLLGHPIAPFRPGYTPPRRLLAPPPVGRGGASAVRGAWRGPRLTAPWEAPRAAFWAFDPVRTAQPDAGTLGKTPGPSAPPCCHKVRHKVRHALPLRARRPEQNTGKAAGSCTCGLPERHGRHASKVCCDRPKGRVVTTTGSLGPDPHKGASGPHCCCRPE